MMVKFLDLYAQYKSIQADIDQAIYHILNNSAFIGGKVVADFEKAFATYQQVQHCIGVGNGTDALEIAIQALNLPVGSEIIVPGNSFIASSEAISSAGHKVVFCDVNQDDYTLSIQDVKKRITKATSAILCVHLYGQACQMNELRDLCKTNHLALIEDCAQAHGAEYNTTRVGSFGDVATFSFYPGKNLGAYGDGGAIVTKDEDIATSCRMIANHGRIAKYDHEFEGRNSRLDGLQAAILTIKLKHLDRWLEQRRKIANLYQEYLSDLDALILPVERKNVRHVYHLYVVRCEKRDALKTYLNKHDIECGVHYPISLPQLKAYEHLGQNDEHLFVNHHASTLLSLPMGEHLNEVDVAEVSKHIHAFFKT